jgi:hypothetical protein
MIKSIVKIVGWIVVGLFIGLMIPPLVVSMFTFLWGAWPDWIFFASIIGSLAVLIFLLLKSSFPAFSQKIFVTLLVIAALFIAALGIFFWQRDVTIKAINSRYIDFCTSVSKNDYKVAYTYMSPKYRQTVTVEAFAQTLDKEDKYSISFLNVCSSYSYTKTDVVIWGNFSTIFLGEQRFFSDPFAYRVFFELEKINGEWYFTNPPNHGGMLD